MPVAHIFNPSTWEADRWIQVWGQPGLKASSKTAKATEKLSQGKGEGAQRKHTDKLQVKQSKSQTNTYYLTETSKTRSGQKDTFQVLKSLHCQQNLSYSVKVSKSKAGHGGITFNPSTEKTEAGGFLWVKLLSPLPERRNKTLSWETDERNSTRKIL